MKPKFAIVVCYKDTYSTESAVKSALQKEGINHKCIKREHLAETNFRKSDLIITVGGDGTFLRAAQYVEKQPVLAVASNLKKNEGFFARANKSDFGNKLNKILNNDYKIIRLNRLESTIKSVSDGERVKPYLAVNEVFIGSKRPYITSRYVLKTGKRQEFQKSSGVIVATAAGSYAWAKSAGGRLLPLESKRIQFIVREPYSGRLGKPKLRHGILPEGASVIIKSLTWDGIVVIDSHFREHKLKEGSSVTIRISNKPLRLISF